jgi:hypothetical protein
MTRTKTNEAVVVLEEWHDENNHLHQLIYYARVDEILLRIEDKDVSEGWMYVPQFILKDDSLPDFNDYSDSLKLTFTGKLSLIIELAEFDPMHIQINDLGLTQKVVLTALKGMQEQGDDDVNEYPEAEGALLKHILNAGGISNEEYQEHLDRHAL